MLAGGYPCLSEVIISGFNTSFHCALDNKQSLSSLVKMPGFKSKTTAFYLGGWGPFSLKAASLLLLRVWLGFALLLFLLFPSSPWSMLGNRVKSWGSKLMSHPSGIYLVYQLQSICTFWFSLKISQVKRLHIWEKVTCLETNWAAFVVRVDAKALENSIFILCQAERQT